MTERVVIEGHGLAVHVDQATDPKRRRPTPVLSAPVTGLTWDEAMVLAVTKPFWTEAENRAAELAGPPPPRRSPRR